MFSEMPLFIFTLLGGCAVGLYVAAAIFPAKGKKAWLLPLVALILLGIGGIALLFHLGRPERVLLAFSNPAAGIAQEGYATIVFGVLVVIDLIVAFAKKAAVRGLRIVAAIAGIALTAVMGNAYMAYGAVLTWGSWQSIPFFVLSALAIGAAFYPVLDKEAVAGSKGALGIAIIIALGAVMVAIEAIHYATVGGNCAYLAVGAACAAVGAVLAYMAGKKEGSIAWLLIFAIVAVGITVARLGFYLG